MIPVLRPKSAVVPRSGIVFPAIGFVFYAATVAFGLGGASALTAPGAVFLLALVVVMIGTVFATVHRLRHREQDFLVRGANSYLGVIVTLAA